MRPDVKTKILFIKHALSEDSNQILKTIITEELDSRKTDWSKIISKYLIEYNINMQTILNNSKELLKNKINTIDERNWKNNMNNKTSLARYRINKTKIEEIKWFRNSFKFSILMRARADALNLNWRRSIQNDKTCKLCQINDETLKHFLLDCTKLQTTRNRFIELQLPRIQNDDKIINKLLMFEIDNDSDPDTYADIILQLWQHRKKLTEEL